MDNSIDNIFAQLMGNAEEPVKTASDVVVEPSKVAGLTISSDDAAVLQGFVEDNEEKEKKAEEMKVAKDSFVMGQIMARGYVHELQKMAAEGDYEEPMQTADFSSAAISAGAADVPTPVNDIVQDGSAAMTIAKKEDGVSSPTSPTAVQDTVKVVKKILEAANVASKGQDPQEVPNNLGVAETATDGQKVAPTTR